MKEGKKHKKNYTDINFRAKKNFEKMLAKTPTLRDDMEKLLKAVEEAK